MSDALKNIESLGSRVERNIPLVTLDELQNLGDKVEIEDLFGEQNTFILNFLLLLLFSFPSSVAC